MTEIARWRAPLHAFFLLSTACWLVGCGLLLDSGPPREQGTDAAMEAGTDAGRDAAFDAAEPCPANETRCGASCVDLQGDDDLHCGGCFQDCELEMCVSGSCQPAWVDVAAGPTHTCAQASDGRVFCWGAAGSRTGSPESPMRSQTPTRITGLDDIDSPIGTDSLALGDLYSCVLANVEGRPEPRCWGDIDSLVVAQSSPVAAPVRSASGVIISVTELRGGKSFACGIDTTLPVHEQFCWGTAFTRDSVPLLGPGTVTTQPGVAIRFVSGTPRPDTLAGFDLGDEYGCLSGEQNGSSIGTLCWGAPNGRNHGQESTIASRVDLTEAFPGSAEFNNKTLEQIEAGELFACGLVQDEKRVVCWGGDDVEAIDSGNVSGELQNRLYPRDASNDAFHIPSEVLVDAYDLTMGDWHACAAVDNGSGLSIQCWGIVPASDPTNPNISFRTFASPVSVRLNSPNPTDHLVTDFAASRFHTCALFDNHELVCWGANHRGQLGTLPVSDDARGNFKEVILCAPDDYESGGACATGG